jgi:hypothetical protein
MWWLCNIQWWACGVKRCLTYRHAPATMGPLEDLSTLRRISLIRRTQLHHRPRQAVKKGQEAQPSRRIHSTLISILFLVSQEGRKGRVGCVLTGLYALR